MNNSRLILFTLVATVCVAMVLAGAAKIANNKLTTSLVAENISNKNDSPPTMGTEQQQLPGEESTYSIDRYLQRLKTQQHRLREQQHNKDLVEQIVLNREIELLQIKIDDLDNAYREHLRLLSGIKNQLDYFRDLIGAEQYQQSQLALSDGDTKTAFQALLKVSLRFVKERNSVSLHEVAAAKYYMGRIAEDNNAFQKAFRFYRQAVQFEPNNIDYLLALGKTANQIALYNNAIQYLESALQLQNKKNENSALKGDILANLASANEAKDQIGRALQYYRRAIDVYRQSLGISHVKTKSVQDKLHRLEKLTR